MTLSSRPSTGQSKHLGAACCVYGAAVGVFLLAVNGGRFFRATHLFWASAITILIMLLSLIVFYRSRGASVLSDFRTILCLRSRTFWWILLCCAFLLRDLAAYHLVHQLQLGLLVTALSTIACFGMLFALLAGSSAGGAAGRANVLMVGVSAYVLANLIAYQLGFRGSHGVDQDYSGALGEVISERMIAPFGLGLNNFGIIAVVGFGMGLILSKEALGSGQIGAVVGSLTCVAVNGVAAFMVQIRTAILVVLVIAVWMLPWPSRLRGAALTIILIPAFAFSLFFTVISDHGWLDMLDGIRPLTHITRQASDIETLGGRIYIWREGWQQVLDGEIGLFGLGPLERDFAWAYGEGTGTFYTFAMSAHNAALEVYVVYGPILFTLFVVFIFGMATGIGRMAADNLISSDQLRCYGGILLLGIAAGMTESFARAEMFMVMIATVTILMDKVRHARRLAGTHA